jgi:anti-sigma B factor antagonist
LSIKYSQFTLCSANIVNKPLSFSGCTDINSAGVRSAEETQLMNLNSQELDKLTIIQIEGEFHIGNVVKFEELWHTLIEKKPSVIALDCSKLDYIDSSAIGTLVKFLNNAMSKKIKLVFFDLNKPIQNIFKTARLDNFFTITTREQIKRDYM